MVVCLLKGYMPGHKIYGVKDVPRTWYKEHVAKTMCSCSLEKPSRWCDVGEALFRLQRKEEKRVDISTES